MNNVKGGAQVRYVQVGSGAAVHLVRDGEQATVIDMIPAEPHHRANWGLMYTSVSLLLVTGKGVYNRGYAHQVQAWASDVTPYTLSARAAVVSTTGDLGTPSARLAMGDVVILAYPDGTRSDLLRVTARQLDDPVLLPLSDSTNQPNG